MAKNKGIPRKAKRGPWDGWPTHYSSYLAMCRGRGYVQIPEWLIDAPIPAEAKVVLLHVFRDGDTSVDALYGSVDTRFGRKVCPTVSSFQYARLTDAYQFLGSRHFFVRNLDGVILLNPQLLEHFGGKIGVVEAPDK